MSDDTAAPFLFPAVGRKKVTAVHKANIINLRLDTRDKSFHTNEIDVEVHDVQQLMRLMAGLRAADAVHSVERV